MKILLKRLQDINELRKVHFPEKFFVQTEFDYSTYTWKWKSGQV